MARRNKASALWNYPLTCFSDLYALPLPPSRTMVGYRLTRQIYFFGCGLLGVLIYVLTVQSVRQQWRQNSSVSEGLVFTSDRMGRGLGPESVSAMKRAYRCLIAEAESATSTTPGVDELATHGMAEARGAARPAPGIEDLLPDIVVDYAVQYEADTFAAMKRVFRCLADHKDCPSRPEGKVVIIA